MRSYRHRLSRDRSIEARPASPSVPVGKLAGVVVIALITANCANQLDRQIALQNERRTKFALSPGTKVAGLPKGGGRSLIGKTYMVRGKSYTPTVDPSYTAVGFASWYGPGFHGRRTANGEVFDGHAFAAAHPTLPLPSYVRVTNLDNSRSMVVRVNDRGPFHDKRLIDVSQATAEALDFRSIGTAKVKVEYIAPADIDGSDDNKLLATLQEGDVPAAPAAAAPVMVASAPEPAQTPRPDDGRGRPVDVMVQPVADNAAPNEPSAASSLVPLERQQPTAAAEVQPAAATGAPDAAGATTQPAALLPEDAPLPPQRPGDGDRAEAEPAAPMPVARTAAAKGGDKQAFASLVKRVSTSSTSSRAP